eukprot:GILI01007426.1.p1 GENE.GILI01007426.1~~GILI01007426.1.p1  ORF type:complete len:156 (-),score=63.84 GILI01007426.1:167-634(-)
MAGVEMSFPELKVGNCVCIKDTNVCKITEVKTSRPGKHGHAKKMVAGKCLITDKKMTEIYTGHSVFKYFTLQTDTYTLVSISDDDFLSLMDSNGEIVEDIQCPNQESIDAELGAKLRELNAANADGVQVSVLTVVIGKDDEAKEFKRITAVTQNE